MTKSDLKTGMIVTLRNGDEYIVFRNTCFDGDLKDFLGSASKKQNILLQYLTDSLLDEDGCEEFDIIKVGIPDIAYSIQQSWVYDIPRTVIWERKDEQQPKEMTIQEIEQELGYKVKVVSE